MKKIIIAIVLLVLAVVIFCVGFYSGNALSGYDVLCGEEHKAHKLKSEFKSLEGVVLPEGAVIYLRKCKPHADARLEFYIDKWDYQDTEKLDIDSIPAYHLSPKALIRKPD